VRVYLAGPDVFLPDPIARGAVLKAICAEHGLEGVFPLDPVPDEPAAWQTLPVPHRIALQNEAHIRRVQALIANLTPFRSPSADVGTVFELGFARALGLPLFAWSNDPRRFADRTLARLGSAARPDGSGGWRDGNDMAVEAFGCVDNLMIDGAVALAGGAVVTTGAGAAGWSDLAAFARCVAIAAGWLRRSSS
jgi:nucleoside 2-deoxyribosyltransferase